MKVTGSPAAASLTPSCPPMAPAPTIAMLMPVRPWLRPGCPEGPAPCGVSASAAGGESAGRCLPAWGPMKGRMRPQTKRLASTPIPAISTSTVAPGLIEPTPRDVPQATMSPGSSVIPCESMATSSAGGRIMSESG